ncbi:hypothetical protein EWM64_g3674 [Hericium alpestre]|uniref:Uncharacterized protein n=1 Tax=Hericium alpestre TaxID=135208 RepID=A0A4Y9ZZN9_9AGAM|nr:hypothetical protein EWM64_g3674 [Hericium alpestre]
MRDPRGGPAVVRLFNACLRLGHWPKQFKESVTVVIPKPGKPDYSVLKAYCPIVLLSCMGKLMEKVLTKRFQFEATKHLLLHPSQFGGAMARSMEDAGELLVHHILALHAKGFVTSCLTMDIAQCFPSIQHDYLPSFSVPGFFSNAINSSSNTLSPQGRTVVATPPLVLPDYTVHPKLVWWYLGFFLDRTLSFKSHIKFYATRALSTVRSYGLLGNSERGLTPHDKCTLYISCV